MSNVYKYSGCNIAATSALDNFEGCFAQRVPSQVLPIRLRFDSSIVSLHSSETRFRPSIEGHVDDEITLLCGLYELHSDENAAWHDDITKAPLNSRGWVLQEVGVSAERYVVSL